MRVTIHGVLIYLAFCLLVFLLQRRMLYFPTHETPAGVLKPWEVDEQRLGYCFEVTNPNTVWFMMHGNAGQASDRDYVLRHLRSTDSLYVLEYPGYGARTGTPSQSSIDQAANEAFQHLLDHFPNTPIGVIGESIGSGPACQLSRASRPPDKIVLIVPFDSLYHVASRRFFFLPVWLLLLDRWDNIEALEAYEGPMDIFAARQDAIIPAMHARNLANSRPQATFIEIPGGHNDWSFCEDVRIER